MIRYGITATLAATLFATSACSDGTGPEDGARLSLSVAAAPAVPQPLAGPARVVTQTDGTNTLTLDRVALVMREIELERADADDCEEASGLDVCEEFEAGPLLVELPMTHAVAHVVTIDVPAASYDEIEFDVHKAERPGDDAFLDQNPDFEGVSIRVEGTFNGESFVFLQDLDEEQEIELSEPLVIGAGAEPSNLTLRMDVTTWFTRGGGEIIDPRSANKGGENEGLVENNIKQSIEAFEDDDGDGDHDDG